MVYKNSYKPSQLSINMFDFLKKKLTSWISKKGEPEESPKKISKQDEQTKTQKKVPKKEISASKSTKKVKKDKTHSIKSVKKEEIIQEDIKPSVEKEQTEEEVILARSHYGIKRLVILCPALSPKDPSCR